MLLLILFPVMRVLHRVFGKIGGGLTAGVLLSQAYFWSNNSVAVERGGWFYKTHAQWEQETGMTRREQETARKHLRERGLLEEREGSIKGKGRVLWFRVNYDALIEALKQFSDEPGAASAETEVKRAGNDPEPSGEPVEDVHECARPDARDGLTAVSKSASGVARKRHTLLITTENTTETTQENTLTRARGALSLAP